MMNKEIIVDGVDVSQCVYRMKDEYNTCCCTSTKENEGEERITAYYGCKYNHNCHYKQLKRKEQECEEKQKTAQDAINKLCAEKSALHNELDQLKAENIKIYKTLTEIKEIAENMNNECFYDDFECKDCDMKNGCTYFNKRKILQIIKEMK